MLRSENVSDDDVVEKPGDGLTLVTLAAPLALFLSRASFLTAHRVGRQTWMVGVVCVSLWHR